MYPAGWRQRRGARNTVGTPNVVEVHAVGFFSLAEHFCFVAGFVVHKVERAGLHAAERRGKVRARNVREPAVKKTQGMRWRPGLNRTLPETYESGVGLRLDLLGFKLALQFDGGLRGETQV